MLGWMLENTVLACALALVVMVVERRVRARPAVGHVMWLTVLLVLVLPPLALRSPVAVRGLVRPHIEELEAAAWARLERTDPGLGWGHEGASESLLGPALGVDASGDAVVALGAEPGRAALVVETPTFRLSPLTDSSHGAVATGVSGAAPVRMLPFAARSVLRAVWLGGAIAVLAAFLVRVRRIDRSVRRASLAPESLLAEIRVVAEGLGVRVPATRVIPGVATPMVWGLGRPTLIWPEELAISADGARGLVAHELAHLRRRDHWLAFVEVLVSAVLWWHPLARVAMSRMDRFAEQACDAWAVRAVSGRRRDYAEALIGVVEQLSNGRRSRPGLAAGGQGRRALADRLGLVMRGDATPSCSRSIVLGAVVLLALLVPTIAPAQPEAQPTAVADAAFAPDDRLGGLIEAATISNEARQWFEAREWDRAAERYEALLAINPDGHDDRARYGIALMHLGRLDDAEREIRAILGDAETRFWLAGVLSAEGRVDESRALLAESLELGLDFVERLRSEPVFSAVVTDESAGPLLDRASRLHELRESAKASMGARDVKAAVGALTAMSVISSRDGSTWHYLSYVQIASGQLDEALVSLDRQQQLGHRVAVAEYNRACVFALRGSTGPAVEAFGRAVDLGFDDYELARSDPDLNSIRGDAAFDTTMERILRPARLFRELEVARDFGEWDKVIAICDDLSELLSPRRRRWVGAERAMALAEQGHTQVAVDGLVTLMDDGFDTGEGLSRIGRAYAIAGDRDRAVGYLVAAVRAGFDNLDRIAKDGRLESVASDPEVARAGMGVVERRELVSFRVSSWKDLEDRARATLDRQPEVATARHELGWALLRQKRYDEAERLFRGLAEGGWEVAASSYNVACCAALAGRASAAIDWLEKAAAAGMTDADTFETDRDLKSLRDEPRFEVLVKRLRDGG